MDITQRVGIFFPLLKYYFDVLLNTIKYLDNGTVSRMVNYGREKTLLKKYSFIGLFDSY